MPSKFIGLILGSTTRRCYAVINPDADNELDNPRHLLLQNEIKEPVMMAKVERGAYEICLSAADLETLINTYYVTSGYKPNEPPPEGPEFMTEI